LLFAPPSNNTNVESAMRRRHSELVMQARQQGAKEYLGTKRLPQPFLRCGCLRGM
jgi:hypothetical protein